MDIDSIKEAPGSTTSLILALAALVGAFAGVVTPLVPVILAILKMHEGDRPVPRPKPHKVEPTGNDSKSHSDTPQPKMKEASDARVVNASKTGLFSLIVAAVRAIPVAMRAIPRRKLVLPIFLFIVSGLIFAIYFQPGPSPPERECAEAWKAFNNGESKYGNGGSLYKDDFERAIRLAGIVTDTYGEHALDIQRDLQSKSSPPPTAGRVLSIWGRCWSVFSPPTSDLVTPAQRDAIFNQGLVNTVATCYFIKGESLKYLDRREEAMEAYQAAMQYPYGRNWEPSSDLWSFFFPGAGSFWSPAKEASYHLEELIAKDKDLTHSR